ncbi:MAG TPA: hypothetical protein VLJ39_23055 [Tepidisphaeraceae bacterium]|jgi:hypothetical protein|nr:hypothetical protein [Tepidisphaeraceae bacterium]
MLAVDATISRVRRDITLGTLLKALLTAAAVGCLVVAQTENVRIVVLLGIGALWFWLSLNGARTSRAAAESPSLIAAGQFEEAERNIEQTVRTFSMIRGVKLQALHHLALLRHAQRRWQESAVLARALLGQRLGTLQPLSKSTRLLLADSLLEMNDLGGTYEALNALSRERLALPEVLNLMAIQLDYSARVGAWSWMVQNVMSKVHLTELLPSASNARAQAFLALAAQKVGRADLSEWLRSRAELLTDVQRLVTERPLLRELWPASEPTVSGT